MTIVSFACRMRKLLHVAGLIGLAACGSTDDEATSARTWLDCMKQVDRDYQPLTAEEMVGAAEVIVRGHLTAAREGRVLDTLSGSSNPMPMQVMEVATSDVLKGSTRGRVYFEEMRASCRPEEMSSGLPAGELMLFLVPTGQSSETNRIDFPDRGLPSGEPLYVLRTPQALIIEADGVVSQPLEPNLPLIEESSLDAIAARVRSVLGRPSSP